VTADEPAMLGENYVMKTVSSYGLAPEARGPPRCQKWPVTSPLCLLDRVSLFASELITTPRRAYWDYTAGGVTLFVIK
jgi:hypothetical protein